MDSRVLPPTDGSVTLPESLDFHLKHNPHESIYVFSEDGKPDITNISYLEFGRAVDRVAHRIRPGRNGPGGQVVAFVALSDTLLYQAVTLGIMRAGLIPYPMSPRNTASAIFKLMKDTSCHRLVTTRETLRPLIDEITCKLSALETPYDLSIEEVPALSEIFPKLGSETAEDPFKPYPRAAVRPPLDDTMLYLHSSGSTGLPKTIRQSFRSFVHWASLPPVTDNRDSKVRLKMAGMALPAFHTLGIVVQLLVGIYSMVPVGLYPPIATTPTSQPMVPTPGNILDHTVRSGCNNLMIIPALLQIWGQDKKAVEILASLEFVAYSGGSVPSKLGNFMTESGVYITPVYGATEFGAASYFFRKEGDEKDWEYMAFSDLTNIRWDPQGDGTYECQFLTSDTHQVSVENLPDVKGYASSDLWIPHPTKPYFWKIVGRKDDVIVHTSGEKTVPAPIEDILMSSPFIMGTIMFGRERDQAGVLIELKPTYAIDPNNEEDLIAIRNTLWPIVEEANKVAPAFSRIFKEMILIASPDKPLPRAGKGTIMRKAALAAYSEEIDDIYAKVEATVNGDAVVPPVSWGKEDTTAWLKAQLEEIHSGMPFSVADDLFDQGMDSLSATILRRRIVGAMQSKDTQQAALLVTQTTIYTLPTIDKLAGFLVGIVADPDNFVLSASRTEAIDLMITKYATGLSEPIIPATRVGPSADGAVILLTGSTGNLGAQLLEPLLRDPRVKTIYTLDRPSSGFKSLAERQAERFVDKGLDASLLTSSRLVALEGEASHRNLGLPTAVYEELRNSATTIIHNAWKLDFNLSLSSFEPNVQGTRNLIDLARSSRNASSLKLLFTSSVSSAFSWDQTKGPYPEQVITDSKYAVGNGYGESKYVAERILSQSGIQATSFRIGQVSGGNPNGAWATSDWVPILVKSSVRMGSIPDLVGLISWLPMHAVSQAILDVAWSEEQSPAALNVVHPQPVAWNSVMSSLNDALVREGVTTTKLPDVEFKEWFSQLERRASNSSDEDLREIPAIKLLDFFRGAMLMDGVARQQGDVDVEIGGLTAFSTDSVRSISATIKTLSPLDQSDALLWVKYWKGVGFF